MVDLSNQGQDDAKIDKDALVRFVFTVGIAIVVGVSYFNREAIIGLLSAEDAVNTVAAPAKNKKERKVKFWRAPMDPSYVRDKPGKSPMGMDLVPIYEEDDDGSNSVKIDSTVVQNIGVRTVMARSGVLSKTIRAVGVVTFNETRLARIQSKVKGWVEKLYIDSTGLKVEHDTMLLELYSPDLVTTQEEYILALEYLDQLQKGSRPEIIKSGEALLESSRRRLELFDVPEHQIKELEMNRKVKKTLHIHSPTDGVVIKKNIVEGMFVKPGDTLYEIADLSNVWVDVEVYEYEAPFVQKGQKAVMTLTSIPGKKYEGLITYVYPFLTRKTRTIRLRLEFDNENNELKPDMYGDVVISTGKMEKAIIIPTEAIIRSGERAVVFIDIGGGRFQPREVRLGMESQGESTILDGVKEDEMVVVSAQFLIDSESKLREVISKMGATNKKSDKPAMEGMDHSKMNMDKQKAKPDKPAHGSIDHSKMNMK